MVFDKLDRLMPNNVDFTGSVTDAFVLFCPKKRQMVRMGFEPTTLGSDFSINIASVLAISATWLHVYVEVKY
jgi:hypothetical protein